MVYFPLVLLREWEWDRRNAEEFNHAEVTEQTGWKLRIKKATTNPSSTLKAINYNLKISASERAKPAWAARKAPQSLPPSPHIAQK